MSDCPRLGKLFKGCKFEPRYDSVGAITYDLPITMFTSGLDLPKPAPSRKTYLCDVCVTCGRTLFRRKPEAAKAKPGKTA